MNLAEAERGKESEGGRDLEEERDEGRSCRGSEREEEKVAIDN